MSSPIPRPGSALAGPAATTPAPWPSPSSGACSAAGPPTRPSTRTRPWAGLLALLHATPSRELRNLKVTDIDAPARTIRLGRRPHPVPLDPASWHALQRCLEHREQLTTRNPHVIVTTHTKTRRTAASDQYLVRILDPAGIGTRTLRATRIIDLVASLDPKLVCEALGMNPAGILPYAADQVQDTHLANL